MSKEPNQEIVYLVHKLQEAHKNGDYKEEKYFNELLKKYEKLIYKIVDKFPIPPIIGKEDIISVCKAATWRAFLRYNPEMSMASTFLSKTLFGEIRRHFRDYGWPVKVTRRYKEAASTSLDIEKNTKQISERFGITEDEVLSIRQVLQPVLSHEDYHDFLEEQEEMSGDDLVDRLLDSLEQIESDLITEFYIEERNLTDIADLYCMDVSKVKQIINTALEKLKGLTK